MRSELVQSWAVLAALVGFLAPAWVDGEDSIGLYLIAFVVFLLLTKGGRRLLAVLLLPVGWVWIGFFPPKDNGLLDLLCILWVFSFGGFAKDVLETFMAFGLAGLRSDVCDLEDFLRCDDAQGASTRWIGRPDWGGHSGPTLARVAVALVVLLAFALVLNHPPDGLPMGIHVLMAAGWFGGVIGWLEGSTGRAA